MIVGTVLAAPATIRVCRATDTECANPTLSGLQVGVDGIAQFDVSQGFSGYLEVTADGFFPTIVPLNGAEEAPASFVPMLLRDEFTRLAAASGVSGDPALGQFFFAATDTACPDQRLAGLRFDITPAPLGAVQYYEVSGLPSTVQETTDLGGSGGAINIPAGVYRVSATEAQTETELSAVNTFVREGWITMVEIDISIAR